LRIPLSVLGPADQVIEEPLASDAGAKADKAEFLGEVWVNERG